MKYDTEQMTFIGTAGTAEESAALALHYEIMAAAQTAAASLLDLARKIKRMRDTSGYKALGFDTLEAYTMATMGMKQRQAYNYIAIAEKLPAQLIEQNAAAGVTKLALLAQLSGQDQQQIAAETNLADTTVAELKAQIKELQAKNAGYALPMWPLLAMWACCALCGWPAWWRTGSAARLRPPLPAAGPAKPHGTA